MGTLHGTNDCFLMSFDIDKSRVTHSEKLKDTTLRADVLALSFSSTVWLQSLGNEARRLVVAAEKVRSIPHSLQKGLALFLEDVPLLKILRCKVELNECLTCWQN